MLPVLSQARELLSTYADMEEMIRLGAYRKGSDPIVDQAIALHPAFEAFLGQNKDEATSIAEGYQWLRDIVTLEPVVEDA